MPEEFPLSALSGRGTPAESGARAEDAVRGHEELQGIVDDGTAEEGGRAVRFVQDPQEAGHLDDLPGRNTGKCLSQEQGSAVGRWCQRHAQRRAGPDEVAGDGIGGTVEQCGARAAVGRKRPQQVIETAFEKVCVRRAKSQPAERCVKEESSLTGVAVVHGATVRVLTGAVPPGMRAGDNLDASGTGQDSAPPRALAWGHDES